ncbi:MAG: 2-oxo acid dehydrogenase subunit E2 [Acholeplasmataceae bacterium]|jgi:pyruvate dehydrogenase E2 component (dihydrolipoamide acetyltransferase)|nr:2-oxo acid dehydrogenase subunit E2 [Acholeplasmataceae bacterium]
MYDFKFADIGDGVVEGVILEWKVKLGDKVNEGDTLVIVETDKVNAELPAPVSGVITKIGKPQGEVIHVGETVVVIDDGSSPQEKPLEEPAQEEKGASVIGEIEVSSAIIEESSEAKETVVEPERKKALATPVARALAKNNNLDINEITGTGPNNRVLKEDILAHLEKQTVPTPPPISKPVFSPGEDVRIEPLSSIRKSISQAMTVSKRTIADTVLMDEVVVDELISLRNSSKGQAESLGIRLTYMAFIAKAAIIALKEFPIFNSSYDQEKEQLVYKNYINLGFAVDTAAGLIVPNIKNAQNLSIFDLAKQIRELATKAVERTIQLPEIQNGTFTITNFGSVGIAYGTPIINYPEVAILGIGKIVKKPIVKDDQITTGFVLPLSLAVDHRIIDGADAGRFLLLIKELLSNPQLMLLR